jgi:hypothetical protein
MSKGSRQRPTNIPMEQADANFESIFGKRVPTYLKKMISDDAKEQEQKGSNDIQQDQRPKE